MSSIVTPSRRALAAALLSVALVACDDADAPDAYGNFEAIEVVVAAQTSGPIERFLVVEGQEVAAGAIVPCSSVRTKDRGPESDAVAPRAMPRMATMKA